MRTPWRDGTDAQASGRSGWPRSAAGGTSARGRPRAAGARPAIAGDPRPVGLPVAAAVEVRPPWPWAPGPASMDGLVRRRGALIERLVHVGEAPVVLRAVQPARDRVVLAAQCADPLAAAYALDRFRFALALDDDLRPFHARFRRDPYIGRALRAMPALRVRRRNEPWEVLQSAISEQLIEFEHAMEIQRRLIGALGRRHAHLRDSPSPQAIADAAPALLAAFGLAPKRALTVRAAAREVASGRADLHARDHEAVGRRLRAIPGIGPWTVEMLALYGQGRLDVVPAGDVAYLKLVGRVVTGRPRARADEEGVREFFDRYDGWRGMAATYLVRAAATGLLTAGAPARPPRSPRPGGTRSSAPARPAA